MAASDRKRRVVTALQVRLFNPLIRALAARGLAPGVALLETRGRRSGELRRTPVSNGLVRGTNTFWLVAEHGRKAGYVRNIEAYPRVSVRLRGGWRTGVAVLLDDEDPYIRLRAIPRLNALAVRALGTELLAIRIDLDEQRRSWDMLTGNVSGSGIPGDEPRD